MLELIPLHLRGRPSEHVSLTSTADLNLTTSFQVFPWNKENAKTSAWTHDNSTSNEEIECKMAGDVEIELTVCVQSV